VSNTNPRRIIWARHVAHVGKKGNSYRAFVRKPGRKNHFEVLGVDGGGMMILKLIFKK